MNSIVEALERLRDKGPVNPRFGICWNVETVLGCDSDTPNPLVRLWVKNCDDAFAAWPHYSGNDAYPIPFPEEAKGMHAAYSQYKVAQGRGELWDETTEYGKLRYMLLDHLIDYFKGLKNV